MSCSGCTLRCSLQSVSADKLLVRLSVDQVLTRDTEKRDSQAVMLR